MTNIQKGCTSRVTVAKAHGCIKIRSPRKTKMLNPQKAMFMGSALGIYKSI